MKRQEYISEIKINFKIHPIVAILGPRQCGKTTLAKEYLRQLTTGTRIHYFDLENSVDLMRLNEPMLALAELTGIVVIDEIQRRPELFPTLRVLVDTNKKCKFLILGSASRELIRQSSETLAGRIAYLELSPFNYSEVTDLNKLWLRGGFPKSYLAQNNNLSVRWRESYIQTFLEQDIPNLGLSVSPNTLRRFWRMLSHYHGQIFNASEIGTALGIAHTTARHYLDILIGTFMVRELQPWFENINKRQVKSPKIYFKDSGIYHSLLGITDKNTLLHHPKLGASWEGMAIEEVIRHHHATPSEAYFWAIHSQAELDLLIIKNGKRLGFEFKYMDAPKMTSSIKRAQEILKPDKIIVIYPGDTDYKLEKNVLVCGIKNYLKTSVF